MQLRHMQGDVIGQGHIPLAYKQPRQAPAITFCTKAQLQPSDRINAVSISPQKETPSLPLIANYNHV